MKSSDWTPNFHGSLSEGIVQLWICKLKGDFHSIQEFLLSAMTVQSLLVILHHLFWKFELNERKPWIYDVSGLQNQVLLRDDKCCDDFLEPWDAGLLTVRSARYWIPMKSRKSPVFSFSKECACSDSTVMTVMALPSNKHMILNGIISVLNPCTQTD